MLEPGIARALEVEEVFELADARAQACDLLGRVVIGGQRREARFGDGHHATSGAASDVTGSGAGCKCGATKSRRGGGLNSLPQRGHSSRDEYAAAVKVARRQVGQCAYGIRGSLGTVFSGPKVTAAALSPPCAQRCTARPRYPRSSAPAQGGYPCPAGVNR